MSDGSASQSRYPACMLCGARSARRLFEQQGRDFVRCGDCGLEWVHPMPTAAELAEYYEHSYAEGAYAVFAEAQQERRTVARYRLRVIAPFAREGRWLDVGASSGDFVEAASERHDAEGLELSATAVREARARGLRVHQGAVEDFAPESPYATVTAFDVLEHLREPRAFLRLLRGWLAPGGRIVLTLPDVSSFYARWLMRRHWFYYAATAHLFYYSPRTVRRLLAEEGFRVVAVRRAYKPLTPRYAAANLRVFNAGLGRVATAATAWLPDAVASRPIPMYVGEMMVVAEPGA